MAKKKKSSAPFPGVGFKKAVLRVILSRGGTFDDEGERLAPRHYAILAMHPDDVDWTGCGPGKIIADLEQFRDAKRFAGLFAAAPELLHNLETIVDMAHSVSSNWESGDLARAVRSLEEIAISAETVIARARGKEANSRYFPIPLSNHGNQEKIAGKKTVSRLRDANRVSGR